MKNPNGCMIETYEGQKGSCWDVGYNAILKANINKDVLISFQENNKGYNTVVELCPIEEGDVTCSVGGPGPMSTSKAVVHKDVNKTMSSEVIIEPRQLSIEAQCIMKCATDLAVATIKETDSYEDTGGHLASYVCELTGALKLAKHNLQCGE